MKRQYSIKDLERLSGIKAHTIRIWEKRYKLLLPKRTPKNIRYYDDEDLKKILDVTILQRTGMKISKISKLSTEEMQEHVETHYQREQVGQSAYHTEQNRLIHAMLDFDEMDFEKAFSSLLLRFGFGQAMLQVVFPFMARVGMLWNLGRVHPGQEHFISNLLRQKIFAAIDGLYAAKQTEKCYLLYLPEDEFHELALLFWAYTLKSNGHQVIYLGQSVPLSSVRAVLAHKQITHLCTVFTTHRPLTELQGHIDDIAHGLQKRQLLIAGDADGIRKLNLQPAMQLVDLAKELL